MPTDLSTARARRAALSRDDTAAVFLLPAVGCLLTLAAALMSPSFAAALHPFWIF
jgi:hypothetical protein